VTARAGDPIPVTISVKNVARGFARSVSVPHSTQADAIGIEIHLTYSKQPLVPIFTFPPRSNKFPGTYRLSVKFTKGGFFDSELQIPAQNLEVIP
jgi:hypothetical protein